MKIQFLQNIWSYFTCGRVIKISENSTLCHGGGKYKVTCATTHNVIISTYIISFIDKWFGARYAIHLELASSLHIGAGDGHCEGQRPTKCHSRNENEHLQKPRFVFFSPPFYGYFVAAGASTLDLICYTSIVSSRKFEILGSHLSLLYVFVYHESISHELQSGKEIWNFLKT